MLAGFVIAMLGFPVVFGLGWHALGDLLIYSGYAMGILGLTWQFKLARDYRHDRRLK